MPRPSSRASESEGDLGLTTLLGDGDALIVGRGRAMESATSGPCDATIVAEQVPDREPVIVSSHVPVTVVDSAPMQVVTSTTTLLGQRSQIPTLGIEPMVTKSLYPQRPVQIPTIITALQVIQTRYSEENSICLSVRPSVRLSVTPDP